LSGVADGAADPKGGVTGDTLTAAAGNTTHRVSRTFAVTNAAWTASVYVKYTNNRWFLVRLGDGTNVYGASFDLQNGAAGAVSGGVTSTITAAPNGMYRCTMTVTPALAGTGNVLFGLQNTDTATSETWNAVGTETVIIWGAQVELGAFATSYIPTVAAVTRAADLLTYPSAGNVDVTNGTAVMTGDLLASAPVTGLSLSGALPILYVNSFAQSWRTTDGTTAVSVTSALTANVASRAVSAWGAGTLGIWKNGGSSASVAFDGSMATGSSLTIGGTWWGHIRNVRIFNTALTAQEVGSYVDLYTP
jgi:hypothetical protein